MSAANDWPRSRHPMPSSKKPRKMKRPPRYRAFGCRDRFVVCDLRIQRLPRAEAEATVDVVADVGADGEVIDVEVVRWAGFGLDEVTAETVRQLHFFPAMKNGVPVRMRVLLRYNFRKPPR